MRNKKVLTLLLVMLMVCTTAVAAYVPAFNAGYNASKNTGTTTGGSGLNDGVTVTDVTDQVQNRLGCGRSQHGRNAHRVRRRRIDGRPIARIFV